MLRFPSGCLWQAVSLRSADRILGLTGFLGTRGAVNSGRGSEGFRGGRRGTRLGESWYGLEFWGYPGGDAGGGFLFIEPLVVGFGGGHGGGFVDHEGAGFFPVLVVGGFHLGGDFGLVGDDVLSLGGVGFHVVEGGTRACGFGFFGFGFGAGGADVTVALVADGEVDVPEVVGFGAGGPAADVGEDVAVFPVGGVAFKEGEEATTFDLVFRERGSGEGGKGGEDIDVGGEGGDVFVGGNFAGPTEEEGDTDAAFVSGAFEAFHACIEEGMAGGEVSAWGA